MAPTQGRSGFLWIPPRYPNSGRSRKLKGMEKRKEKNNHYVVLGTNLEKTTASKGGNCERDVEVPPSARLAAVRSSEEMCS